MDSFFWNRKSEKARRRKTEEEQLAPANRTVEICVWLPDVVIAALLDDFCGRETAI
jgi:hypothetical protein